MGDSVPSPHHCQRWDHGPAPALLCGSVSPRRMGRTTTTGSGMGDRVTIEGLRAFGYHGVLPHEKERGQWFVLDVAARLDLSDAGRTDDLTRTVDYGVLAREVRKIVESERY